MVKHYIVNLMVDELRMLKLEKDRSIVDIIKLPSIGYIKNILNGLQRSNMELLQLICN